MQESGHGGRSVALVSHHSANKIASAQNILVRELRDRLGSNRLLHIPVFANLSGLTLERALSREPE